MKKLTLWLLLLIFISTLVIVRLTWNSLMLDPDAPKAVRGVMDLRSSDLLEHKTINLDGEWGYVPGQLVDPAQFDVGSIRPQQEEWMKVPSKWKSAQTSNTHFGIGTYRLTLLMNASELETYQLRMKDISSSSTVYVNGVLVGQAGIPSEVNQGYEAKNLPYTVSFRSQTDQVDIVIHVANYSNKLKGGIVSSIEFGTVDHMFQSTALLKGIQIIVCVIMLIHGLYACIVYMLGGRHKALLVFSLLIIASILMIVVDDEKLLFTILPEISEWNVRILFASYVLVGSCLLHFFRILYPDYWKKRTILLLNMLGIASIISIVTLPELTVQSYSSIYFGLFFLQVVMTIYQIYVMVYRREPASLFLLLALITLLHSSIWGAMKNLLWRELGYYPIDIIVAFLLFAAFWFKRYIGINEQTQLYAEKLEQADKKKDDFLANTSHELRNPLHSMLNIAQHLLDQEQLNERSNKTESLELLISVGRRMSCMVDDLLDFSRLKDSDVRLELTSISLHQVVAVVVDMLRFMIEGKLIHFKIQIPEHFPHLLADENRLIQILLNLLHNAVKHTNEGMVTIDATVEDQYAIIRIIDNGHGMDEALQRRIFLPYEQGDSSITSMGGGIGLGLSICKQLIELHGGTISVQSAIGEGSVFTISLPLSGTGDVASVQSMKWIDAVSTDEDSTVTTEGSSSPSQVMTLPNVNDNGSRLQIMLVDDDPANLYAMKKVLSSSQYEITIAANGHAALKLLNTRRWSLIISDVMMPHMSGYELAVQIRTQFSLSELPIILLTAGSRPEAIEAGFSAGANDYVMKPVEVRELQARVSALIDLQVSVQREMRMEAAWLQAQMKPHFIFNTLNTISSLSSLDPNRMMELLHAFSNYLRASFDFQNAGELVSIDNELDLVRSYLFIEQERFRERLQVVWDLDSELSLYIPPLSIQTLVENALRHGILNRPEGGTIHITIKDLGSSIRVSIEDNGVGMSEERLQQVQSMEVDATMGIGIRNTDHRLKQTLGSGLMIRSAPGRGTTISFQMDKILE